MKATFCTDERTRGPVSRPSYLVWRRQGGKDRPGFKWTPRPLVGRVSKREKLRRMQQSKADKHKHAQAQYAQSQAQAQNGKENSKAQYFVGINVIVNN